jgi:hypothetical protein
VRAHSDAAAAAVDQALAVAAERERQQLQQQQQQLAAAAERDVRSVRVWVCCADAYARVHSDRSANASVLLPPPPPPQVRSIVRVDAMLMSRRARCRC